MSAGSLSSIAYARGPLHQRFVLGFEGKLKGRYLLSFLAGIQYLGGSALRESVTRDLGNPSYALNEWYPARDMVLIFDRAARAGLALDRLGELVMPTYKRANPQLFEGRSLADGFALLERGYREDTSYGGVSPGHQVEPGCVRLFRTDSPVPCDFFIGVVRGVLAVFGASGTVQETACQWRGAPSCCFEARWQH